MQPDVPIIIPSAGRAAAVLTRISGAILYVPESQAAAYRQHNPGVTVEAHADDAHRNLAAKRQDIYARWGHPFQVDDDIAFVSRLHLPGNNRTTHLTPDEVHHLIQRTAHQARAASCCLYGFNSSPNAKHYYPHKPVSLTAYINASAFGLWESPALYFTPRTTAAESHWINLLNAYAHRKAWVDMRFCFAQAPGSTFFRPGGQTAHRTLATELQDTLFLRRMFGAAVRLKRNRGDARSAHPYQRTIHNPL
jgi:hypothetical protein